MKRSSFIKQCAAFGALIGSPFLLLAKRKDSLKKGFKVASGQDRFGKSISLLEGDTFYTKVSTRDTNGDMYIFESSRVKKGGPALHVHPEQDEWWQVLEGEFLIKVGDETFTLKAGDTAFGPRGVPHAFAKTNEGSARLLMIFQPAGKMEEWFQMVSEGKIAKMTEEEQAAARKEHGFERVGPALDYLKQY